MSIVDTFVPRIVGESACNKMTATSLAVVFAPTLVEHDPTSLLPPPPTHRRPPPAGWEGQRDEGNSVNPENGRANGSARPVVTQSPSAASKEGTRAWESNVTNNINDIVTTGASDVLSGNDISGDNECPTFRASETSNNLLNTMVTASKLEAERHPTEGVVAGSTHPTTSLISTTSNIINAITKRNSPINNNLEKYDRVAAAVETIDGKNVVTQVATAMTAQVATVVTAQVATVVASEVTVADSSSDETTPLVKKTTSWHYIEQGTDKYDSARTDKYDSTRTDKYDSNTTHSGAASPLSGLDAGAVDDASQSVQPMIGSPYNGFLNPCYQSNMSLSSSVSPRRDLKPDHLLCMKFAALEPKVLELLIEKHALIIS